MPGRILIVERDEPVRTGLCAGLRAQGVDTDAMSDGAEVVSAIRSGRYAIVLLDLAVRVKTGFEIVNEIRGDTTRPIVIALSDSAEEVRRLAGDPAVVLSINKNFAMRNMEPVIAAIVAVSRMSL